MLWLRMKPRAIVIGDPAIEVNFARLPASPRAPGSSSVTSQRAPVRVYRGPAAVYRLISLLGWIRHEDDRAWLEILGENCVPSSKARPDVDIIESLGVCQPAFEGNTFIWRLHESLGFETRSAFTDFDQPVANAEDLLLVYDAGLSRRELPPLVQKYQQTLSGERPIVIDLARLPNSPLPWKDLSPDQASRCVVVVSARHLRQMRARIHAEVSWEATTESLLWELNHNPELLPLREVGHLVVSFDNDGAIVVSQRRIPQVHLVIDSGTLEGDFAPRDGGRVRGYNNCISASLAYGALTASSFSVEEWVAKGLAGVRMLHRYGYGMSSRTDADLVFRFPAPHVARAIVKPSTKDRPFRVVPAPGARASVQGTRWSLLDDAPDSLIAIAQDVVRSGVEALVRRGIPLARFGKLLTVDRQEIESLRGVRQLLLGYDLDRSLSRPLSIAVFGAPGAGKSFGIEQVAKGVLGDKLLMRRFNVAQWWSTDLLISALHQVRDAVLSGKFPIVLWDEFDSNLGQTQHAWLRYFLAPMQDGEFEDKGIVHSIGRCVFVFAGGTSGSFEAFAGKHSEDAFIRAKGPDFISRLRGFVNVRGVNPCDTNDTAHIVRRALTLRAILQQNYPNLFRGSDLQIDDGVLNALLFTPTYRHGARSLSAIVEMSSVAGSATTFERSRLPSESQLRLHVDSEAFTALLYANIIDDPSTVASIARGLHEVWRSQKTVDGWTHADKRDDVLKKHPGLCDFDTLPDSYKEDRRESAREVRPRLASVLYRLRPVRGDEAAIQLTFEEVETLARFDHDAWKRRRESEGWTYSPSTDEGNLRHSHLVDWDDPRLPERAKDVDRAMARSLPDVLKRVGFSMERVVNTSP